MNQSTAFLQYRDIMKVEVIKGRGVNIPEIVLLVGQCK
jgi:hypothetical protein